MDYKQLLSNRIKKILKDLYNGNYTRFGNAIGVTEGSIRAYVGEKRDKDGNIKITVPTADKVVVMVENIGINSEWLLFGKGEMMGKSEGEKFDDLSKKELLKFIKSQQWTIQSQQETINLLANKKNDTEGSV